MLTLLFLMQYASYITERTHEACLLMATQPCYCRHVKNEERKVFVFIILINKQLYLTRKMETCASWLRSTQTQYVFVCIFMFICCWFFGFFFNVFSPLTDGDRPRCAWLQLSSEPLMQSSTEPVGGKNAFVTLNPCSVSTDDIIV